MKSTFVNTLPFALSENKPGLIPSYFSIPKAPRGEISSTLIDDGYVLLVIPLSSGPPIKSPQLGEKIAQSLVDDYIGASLAIDMTPNNRGVRAVPGLFWLLGEVSQENIIKSHSKKVEKALEETKLWFFNLVRMADDDWTKHHIHKAISDLQRQAASYLDLDREWNVDPIKAMQNRCWSCKAPFYQGAIICSGCNAILDAKLYEANKDRFVAGAR